MSLQAVPLTSLRIRDERSFRHVALYAELKQRLVDDGYRFRVPAKGEPALDWARALFLNLTYWNAGDANDVLPEPTIEADVVAHAAWHHVVRGALSAGPASTDALLFGEAVASAFDLYLVGRVVGHVRRSDFLDSQVPAMAEVARSAGLSDADFEALIAAVADDPAGAFEDLRALLFDVTTALVGCEGVDAAAAVLAGVEDHRFACLLHHYELATWVLYSRAYGRAGYAPDAEVRALDQALRAAPDSLDVLRERCLVRAPAAS